MGVSDRCKGFNLLNHIRQKNYFESISVTYTQIMTLDEELCDRYLRDGYYKDNWIVELKIDDILFSYIDKSKRVALLNSIESAETFIRQHLDGK